MKKLDFSKQKQSEIQWLAKPQQTDGRLETMGKPIRILLQTTIPHTEDDWNIGRFSLLRSHLESLKDETGEPMFAVTSRDRTPDASGNDPVLANLGNSEYDELWLFGVDCGDGLTPAEGAGIEAFHKRGGGLLLARDHQDLGISFGNLGTACQPLYVAHHFHTVNQEPDPDRCCEDDITAKNISWPNYHSGDNGDCQKIALVEPVHELLKNPASPSGVVEYFPSHPHEGTVSVPPGATNARVIATGKSKVTGRSFNLLVAFDSTRDAEGNNLGRAIAEASFHHLADYNWNPDMGCPSFVDAKPSDRLKLEPQLLDDVKAYVKNAALWLAS